MRDVRDTILTNERHERHELAVVSALNRPLLPVVVAERRLAAEAEATDFIVRVTLGRVTILRVHRPHGIERHTNAVILEHQERRQRRGQMQLTRRIGGVRIVLLEREPRIVHVRGILTHHGVDRVLIQTRQNGHDVCADLDGKLALCLHASHAGVSLFGNNLHGNLVRVGFVSYDSNIPHSVQKGRGYWGLLHGRYKPGRPRRIFSIGADLPIYPVTSITSSISPAANSDRARADSSSVS